MQTHPADRLPTAKLRASRHRVTSQRLVIYRELHARKQHVTADQLLDAVSPALPGIAIPTVYATLFPLQGLGRARPLSRAPRPYRLPQLRRPRRSRRARDPAGGPAVGDRHGLLARPCPALDLGAL